MKYWEFLIQKEGDQTWLPLETRQVEILEGRYRVVAHTDRTDTPLEIRVGQLATDEAPPQKRVKKRTSRTNETGLVVVVPFMHLKPGQWALQCSSLDATDGAVGKAWQYDVQLQVFAHTEEDWSAEWPVPNDSETAASAILEDENRSGPTSLMSASPLLQAKAALKAQLQRQNGNGNVARASDAPSKETNQDPGQEAVVPSEGGYRISLRQQAYLARHNQPMTIVGKVNAFSDGMHSGNSQLWIRLQNPKTAQVIMEAHRPLSLARLPADFKVQIQLPAEVTTRIILGEVSLRLAAVEPGAQAKVLTSTAFTITAGIAQLLDAIAAQATNAFEEAPIFPSSTQVLPSAEASSAPEISVPLLDPTYKSVAPAVGVVLPSQSNLIASDPPIADNFDPAVEEGLGDRTLPPLEALPLETPPLEAPPPEIPAAEPGPPPLSYPPMVSQPAQFVGTSILEDDLEADEIAAVLEDIDQDLLADGSDLDTLEPPGIEDAIKAQPFDPPTAQQSAKQTIELPGESIDLVAPALSTLESDPEPPAEGFNRKNSRQSQKQVEASIDFQSLKLKDHFWNRLSNLTHTSHQEATKIAEGMKAAGVSRDSSAGLPTAPKFASDDSEVVIYDEPVAAIAPPKARSMRRPDLRQPAVGPSGSQQYISQSEGRRQTVSQQANVANKRIEPNSNDLPEMALPVISVPMGDLVAGERVTITVTTRPSAYKPFIKLWMIDRQSRSLVIEPKLLTGLVPDALGDLQASAELQVPLDCLDVQIAAIAVDMATQQESGKAIVNRHIVPANQLPASGFSRPL
ncbi:MAG: hypothetical protein WA885_10005 [Phormidesmis sp.]